MRHLVWITVIVGFVLLMTLSWGKEQASDFLASVHSKLLVQAKLPPGAASAGKGN